MTENQMQISKELTLAVIDKLSITEIAHSRNGKEVADAIGDLYQAIAKKVSEAGSY